MGFRRRGDDELDTLDNEAIIAYIRAASDAGELEAAQRALAIAVWGNEANVRRRMALRVPAWAVEECAHEALARAFGSSFAGSSVGEFRSWLSTIVDRTAADFYRRADRRPKEAPLPDEHADEDEVWRSEIGFDGGEGAAEVRIVMAEVLDDMKAEHREVVLLHVIAGHPAQDVCERVGGMQPDNVAQIASRFRRTLRAALDAGPEESAA